MRVDLIEVEPKKKKIKILLIFLAAIAFIVCFSLLGIHCAKQYKAEIIKEKINTIKSTSSKKENFDHKDVEDRVQIKNAFLPIYSEKAKKEMQNIYNKNIKIAYLTFDDGPSQAVTPLILNVLKEENIKATFFVLGSNVKKNPEIVKRAYLEGHYIANHGYSHNYDKLYKTPKKVLEEYNKTEKSIQKAIENNKYNSHLFRFPGGYTGGKYAKIKKEAGKLLNKNDISYIDWNCLSGDAEGANTKEKIIKNIKKYSKDKGTLVILMHDSSSKILTYETLKDVINYLREEGYTFNNFYNIMK